MSKPLCVIIWRLLLHNPSVPTLAPPRHLLPRASTTRGRWLPRSRRLTHLPSPSPQPRPSLTTGQLIDSSTLVLVLVPALGFHRRRPAAPAALPRYPPPAPAPRPRPPLITGQLVDEHRHRRIWGPKHAQCLLSRI